MPPPKTPDPLDGYEQFLGELKQRIRSAQVHASLAVNQELVVLYWGIGHDVLERQKREGWGAKVIDRLARDLSRAFPGVTGFSARNIKYMRAFAEAWPEEAIVQASLAQIPWYHHIALIEKVKSPEERLWYARQTVENGWSRNVLVHQIEGGLYRRQGKALTNFDRTLPAPQSELAQELLKDPYNFDFLSLGPELLERDLERGLIEHMRNVLLELGKGFAFVGSQYHLEVGGQDYYLDLLFYHLRLRCYIVFDLKIEDFKPEFAGKMNFYLSAVDDMLRHPDDKASIGIILCKGRNEIVVEYALRDTAKPVGVAQYRLTAALPEELKEELPTYEDLSAEFPLLSLVRLRIDIEKRLSALVKAHGLENDEPPLGASLLATILHQEHLISTELMANVGRVTEVLNRAVHGQNVTPDDAEAAIKTGSRILAELDRIE